MRSIQYMLVKKTDCCYSFICVPSVHEHVCSLKDNEHQRKPFECLTIGLLHGTPYPTIYIAKRFLWGLGRVSQTITLSTVDEESFSVDKRIPHAINRSTLLLKSNGRVIMVCTVVGQHLLFNYYDVDNLTAVLLLQFLLLTKYLSFSSVSNKRTHKNIPASYTHLCNVLVIQNDTFSSNVFYSSSLICIPTKNMCLYS